jgi:hypothetical protein
LKQVFSLINPVLSNHQTTTTDLVVTDGVKAAEVGGQSEVVCTMADTGFDYKGA